MGFWGGGNKASTKEAAATATDDTNASKAGKASEATKATQKSAAPSLSEEERIALLVGGADPDGVDARAAGKQKFLASNSRHLYADVALSGLTYFYSGAQHLHGQSNALTLLSMWAAGTTFLVNAGLRSYVGDLVANDGVYKEYSMKNPKEIADAAAAAAAAGTNLTDAAAAKDNKNTTVGGGTNAFLESSEKISVTLHTMSPADVMVKQKSVFQMEAVGSWVWLLSSFQQFRMHKQLRWAGYSSWFAMGSAFYFTMRYMYNIMIE